MFFGVLSFYRHRYEAAPNAEVEAIYNDIPYRAKSSNKMYAKTAVADTELVPLA